MEVGEASALPCSFIMAAGVGEMVDDDDPLARELLGDEDDMT